MDGRDYVVPDDVHDAGPVRCSPTGCCPASRPRWAAAAPARSSTGIVASVPVPDAGSSHLSAAGTGALACARRLAALTTRGRAFVAAGITAVVCAVLLGQDDLARVGVLLRRAAADHGVPASGAAATGSPWCAPSPRSWSPPASPRRCSSTLTNEGRTPTGLLLLEDQVPYVLGTRPRFVVDRMGRGWRRAVTYLVRSDVRGRFAIGPMTVRVADPFGLVELDRTFPTTAPLMVTPRTVALPAIPLTGAWTGSGDNRPRAFAGGSAEDVTVREYRRGDDLRRVHWRSSARTGELMVRREEQPWQSRATLFLDNRLARPPRARRRLVPGVRGVRRRLDRDAPRPSAASWSGWSPPTARSRDTVWHDRALDAETGPLLEALAVVTAASADIDDRLAQPRRPHRPARRGARRPRHAATVRCSRRMQHHGAHAARDRPRRGPLARAGRPPGPTRPRPRA